MNRSLTALASIGFTLAATAGHAASPATGGFDPGPLPAASGGLDATTLESEVSATFDEVIFAAYPDLVGRQFVTQLTTGNLAQAVATALNSDGDEFELNLGGELFVPIPELPFLTVGGAFELHVKLSRHVSDSGQTVFELTGDAESLAAGRVSAGIAGVEFGNAPARSVTLQFTTRDALVAAIQTIVIGQAVGHEAQAAVDALKLQVTALNKALQEVQAVRNYFVGWLSRYLPGWVVDRLNVLNATRSKLQSRLNQLSRLAALSDGYDQAFLNCPVIVQLDLGTAASASLGTKLFEVGGDATGMLGIEWESGVEPSMSVLAELKGGKLEAATLELHLKESASLNAGIFGTLAGSLERELVVTGSGHFTDEGFQIDSVGDEVAISFDRSYTAAVWASGGAQYSAGRKTRAFIDLSTLAELGVEGMRALVGRDAELAADLLAELPVTFEGEARVERTASSGFTLAAAEKWLEVGVHATAKWTDVGTASAFEGLPGNDELRALFSLEEGAEQVQATLDILSAVAEEIGARSPR